MILRNRLVEVSSLYDNYFTRYNCFDFPLISDPMRYGTYGSNIFGSIDRTDSRLSANDC